MISNTKVVISVFMIIVAVLFRDVIQNFYLGLKIRVTNKQSMSVAGVYSTTELSQYNGIIVNKLFLSVLGNIFDVTTGKQHYSKGGPYHYFIGKDGSRALITGNFKDESNEKDHVLDLNCGELEVLVNWKKTFYEKYHYIGVLNGRFYDKNGKETEYSEHLSKKIEQCEAEKEIAQKREHQYPPCNMEWNAEKGTRVWCTVTSGGVSRSWAGVPRLLYTPGKVHPQCVCVHLKQKYKDGLLKEYDNCPQTSSECKILT